MSYIFLSIKSIIKKKLFIINQINLLSNQINYHINYNMSIESLRFILPYNIYRHYMFSDCELLNEKVIPL
jgi:hypothetical protein